MRLMDLLPSGIYGDNATMQELQALFTVNINTLADDFNTMLNECFVGTASALLSRYEEVYGLEVNVSKSNTWRRERITAKIRGTGTTTKQMIEEVAMSFSGGEVAIHEYQEEYRFVVQFIGVKGIPQNMAGLIAALDEIKPAHLVYSFKYTYTIWSQLTITWGESRQKLWGDLRIYEGE